MSYGVNCPQGQFFSNPHYLELAYIPQHDVKQLRYIINGGNISVLKSQLFRYVH